MGQKRDSLTHRTLAGMLWAAYGKVAFHVTRLVVLGILARLLTPADFGLVSAALVVTGLLQMLTLGGLFFWALFDMVMIATGNFTDVDGAVLKDWT